MVKAVWNGKILAESDDTVRIEGNHYFPPDSVNWEYFEDSNSHTFCSWKGKASYYNVKANDNENKDAAWYYADPSYSASPIKDHIAFWHGVKVTA